MAKEKPPASGWGVFGEKERKGLAALVAGAGDAGVFVAVANMEIEVP